MKKQIIWSILLGLFCEISALPAEVDAKPVGSNRIIRANKRSLPAHGAKTIYMQKLLSDTDAPPLEKTTHPDLTENLWGPWLLNMALSRDTQYQKLLQKLGGLDRLNNAAIIGVSLLSVAESVDSLTQDQSQAANIMGLVGTTVPLGTLAYSAWRENRVRHQLKDRQAEIEAALNQGLLLIEQDELSAKNNLSKWVGEKAAGQFIKIWQITK